MNQIIEIKEYNAKELDIFARDTENMLAHYYEPHGGLFIAESPKVIMRALDAGYEPEAFLLETAMLPHALCPEQGADDVDQKTGENDPERAVMQRCIARCEGVRIYTAKHEVLEKITGYKLTRGALCAMHRKKMMSLEELLALEETNRIAVIDNVENPTNVGAIFRSAAAMGMDAVVLTGDSSDPLYRRAIRVSMGTVFQIPWTVIDRSSYKELQAAGFRLAAMALSENSVSISDPQLAAEEKLAVLMGNEGEGLSDAVISLCDYTVKIPMTHGVDSLNVAAASAVAFWQLGNPERKQ